jgi:hypothetical protein
MGVGDLQHPAVLSAGVLAHPAYMTATTRMPVQEADSRVQLPHNVCKCHTTLHLQLGDVCRRGTQDTAQHTAHGTAQHTAFSVACICQAMTADKQQSCGNHVLSVQPRCADASKLSPAATQHATQLARTTSRSTKGTTPSAHVPQNTHARNPTLTPHYSDKRKPPPPPLMQGTFPPHPHQHKPTSPLPKPTTHSGRL